MPYSVPVRVMPLLVPLHTFLITPVSAGYTLRIFQMYSGMLHMGQSSKSHLIFAP
ncbi:hypothetical protein BD289DRAFT_485602 [Coniella lustricola]|uniref:Uncharacterized protein n=1 Tax=Coniella lustricola TaxID=2025994 RepID=A0A2T2ZY12_9PEZI|nr:hypothetical protein BD289DRAFT_485602 [Coniella lustricola]